MRLTLRLRTYCGKPPEKNLERTFDQFPVVIGRSSACDFILNDPGKYISANHAIIRVDNEQPIIEDTSSNGTYLNGSTESVGRGNQAALNNGDSLTIGDYSLSLAIQQDSSDNHEDEAGEMRFDEPATADPFDPFRDDQHDWTPASQSSSSDNFWDSDELAVARTGSQQPSSSPPAPAQAPSSTIDSEWDDWPASDASNHPSEPDNSDPHNLGVVDPDLDWLPDAPAETVSVPRPIDHPGSVPIAANPYPQARSPDNSQHSGNASTDAALAIVLRAAGVSTANFGNLDAEQTLATLGRILGLSLEGVMQLLHSRAELKNAIRTDVTRLARDNNNPLKFSASADDALNKLLIPQNRKAYLQAEPAINEAIEDLKAHQLAMLEGMKAAVHAMLVQFDPLTLEKTLESANPITANIPITREAKLWQLFNERFNDIHEEAVNDFDELFGKEFRKAYDRRIRKLGRQPDL